MNSCPKCNAKLPMGAAACPNCGYALKQSNHCLCCGKAIPAGATYCKKCDAADAEASSRKKSHIHSIEKVIVVCIICVVLIEIGIVKIINKPWRAGDAETGGVVASAEAAVNTPAAANLDSDPILEDDASSLDLSSPPNTATVSPLPSSEVTEPIVEPSSIATAAPLPSSTAALAAIPPDTENLNPSNFQEMMVSGVSTTLGLRSSPEKTDNEIGQLENYSLVNVIDQSDSKFWYVYSVDLDAYGYVTASYLTEPLVIGSTQTITLSDQHRDYVIHVPYINLDSTEIYDLNRHLRDEVCSLGFMELSECYGITYHWYINGDMLSLIMEKDFVNKNYTLNVFNISISGMRLATDEEVLSACGYSSEAIYYEALSDAISGYIRENMVDYDYYTEDDVNEYVNRSIDRNNLESAELYMNGDGLPCAAATYYFPAGGEMHNAFFNLETGDSFLFQVY